MIPPWPAEDEAVLRKLWKSGHTGTQISDALGGRYSRNAVQGKADRLGLANRPRKGAVALRVRVETVPKRRGPKPANPRGNPSVVKPKPLPPAKPVQRPSLSLPFPALERRQCQWSTTPHTVAAADHRFCGHPVEPSRPFCPAHCAIAYAAPKQ